MFVYHFYTTMCGRLGYISSPVQLNMSHPLCHAQLASSERVQSCFFSWLQLADGCGDTIELLSPPQPQHAALCLQIAGLIAFTATPALFHLLYISRPQASLGQERACSGPCHPLLRHQRTGKGLAVPGWQPLGDSLCVKTCQCQY